MTQDEIISMAKEAGFVAEDCAAAIRARGNK